jgi:hypothetical protein
MKPIRYVLVALMAALPAAAAQAALDARAQQEVRALLDFVGHSHCSFIRNGSSYSGAEAQAHLQQKLDYLVRKDRVDSAEQFIQRAASESSLSGQPYKVSCDGKERLSRDWLQEELQRLRVPAP